MPAPDLTPKELAALIRRTLDETKFPFSEANRKLRAALAKMQPTKPQTVPKPEIPGASKVAIRGKRRR